MGRMSIGAAAVAAALGLSGCFPEGRETMTIPVRHPETGLQLVQVPTANDMRAVYPPAARQRGIEGRAVLRCRLTATGLFADCRVEQENPPGVGFGEAALKVASRFRATPLAPDVRIKDRDVRLPVNFRVS